MSNPIITINLAAYNGGKYIHQCLDSVLAQSYTHEFIEINVWDNGSTDNSMESLKDLEFRIPNLGFAKFTFEKSKVNLGMWPAQEELLKHSSGKYIVVLSVDVLLHPDFVKNAIEAMERDETIGALQAKVYKYEPGHVLDKKIIDTLGFEIYRSRRIVNIGHGEIDSGQYNKERQIFAVEGAVPVFRKKALEDCRLESQGDSPRYSSGEAGRIVEPDFFWYGDDLDLAWRLGMFGWKQAYIPNVIAWHDRKTTKTLAGGWKNFIKIRKTVPIFKRRLDWRNTTLTIIKNDFAANLWRDLPHIFWRQLLLWGYFLIFEPAMFLEIFKVARMLPNMLKRRGEIMRKALISAKDFRQWIRS